VSDGSAVSAPATVSITVTAVNDAPLAVADAYTTPEDSAIAFDLRFNDSDVEGGALSATVATAPAHGTLTPLSDGRFVYTPVANYAGSDRFSYRVGDGSLTSAVTPVDLTVTPVNDAPVLQPVADVSVVEGTQVSVQLVASDIDDPVSALSYVLDTAPAGAAIDASGRLGWRASDGGADIAFMVHAVDAQGAVSAAQRFVVHVADVVPTPPTPPTPPVPTPTPTVLPPAASATAALPFTSASVITSQRGVGQSEAGVLSAGGIGPGAGDPLRKVTVVAQTAHPGAQVLGFAQAEGAPPGSGAGSLADLLAVDDPAKPPATLQVRMVSVSGSGLHLRFNQQIDSATLGRASAGEPVRSGIVVVMRGDEEVRGTLVPDPDGAGFRFTADSGLLRPGEYSLLLRSGSSGFVDLRGGTLDGDYDGKAGGDYRARFSAGASVLGAADSAAPLFGSADSFESMLGQSTGLPWLGEPLVESMADPASSLLSLLGGAGGTAMLLASIGPWGVAAPVRKTPAARRDRPVLPAARRRTGIAAMPAADPPAPRAEAAIEVRTGGLTADGLDFALARKSPGWVSRWLDGQSSPVNDWRIRL
jgi:hypothetical protein